MHSYKTYAYAKYSKNITLCIDKRISLCENATTIQTYAMIQILMPMQNM